MSSLPDRVERDVAILATRMVERFVEVIPVYATLPAEELHGEVHAVCVQNLRLLLRCLREARPPDDVEVAEMRASAARRAAERVPLDAVLTAYLTGAELTYEAMTRLAGEDDVLLPHVPVILAYLRVVVAGVSAAYVEEQQSITGEERDVRRDLTESLLTSGSARHTLAERAGLRLPATCRAVALRFGLTDDEQDTAVSAAVAGRRKVRRAQEVIERSLGGVLTLLDVDGGALILPVDVDAPDHPVHASHPSQQQGRAGVEVLDRLRDALAEAVRAPVWLAASDALPLAELPRGWHQARQIRALVDQTGRPAGVHLSEDVLLEQTVAADPDTARRLQRLLAPLEDREDLLATLDAWYAADFDRRAAAQVLTVHPNTLDHRLRRIGELTGYDLATAIGSQLIGAALLARRLTP